MATLLPNGKQQFIDSNGNPFAGGFVYFYVPNTETPKDTWQDASQATLNDNPVELDASGEAIIYGSGTYRQVLTDADGNEVWDQLTESTDSSGVVWGGVSTGTANAQIIDQGTFASVDGTQVNFIAGFTNTNAMTLQLGADSAAIPVLKNSSSGPVPLTGSEVVEDNSITVIYDADRGAFLLSPPSFGGISGSTIILKQSTNPTPTTEGDIQWDTDDNTIKIGDGSGTKTFSDDSKTALLAVQDQVITGGARVTPLALGTITTGTRTLDPGDCQLQSYTNGGAHTLAPGSNTGSILLDVTNNASAGAITVSGWTKVVGAFDTTNAHKFRCMCSVNTGGSLLVIQNLF